MNVLRDMPTLSPGPSFECYYKDCRKGAPETKVVSVNESPMARIGDATEINGLRRDNFEVHEISKEEFEQLRSK